jgi:hypothetical protein
MRERRVPGRDAILPGEQSHARRVAFGRVAQLRKPQTIICQAIQMGRPDLASVTAQIGKAHVIGDPLNRLPFYPAGHPQSAFAGCPSWPTLGYAALGVRLACVAFGSPIDWANSNSF